ncbi:hypothetical protein CDAR_190431 [Caerostris darwini]|uniref:Uncharacterized protein n=1 Tax=Caerostris darwini TaxID=1538125 RepID=A0AAV4MPG6_9ARAC|nr:hypothetical protein CDAR_190431 [Caerostris darwini]
MTAATPSEQDSGIRNYPGSKLTGPQNKSRRSIEKKYSSKSFRNKTQIKRFSFLSAALPLDDGTQIRVKIPYQPV